MSPAAVLAQGHWRHLLPQLGVPEQFLTSKHGPCPICGGKDRFRWDDFQKKGGYFCSQCGSGDGFDLAHKVTGQSFKEIANRISNILGKSQNYEPKKPDQEEIENRKRMKTLWEASGWPSEVGPVAYYLKRRVGCLWPSNSIREGFGLVWEGQKWAAMVSKIITHTDQAVNLHLTYLDAEGHKADVIKPKRVMSGKLPDGCAVRLGKATPAMGVAEGIESAISASILYDMPVWACVNGTLLSKWIPPEIAEEVHIFGDNDANYTGQAKAFMLANRLEVQFKRRVKVIIPPVVGKDMNDVHRDKMQSGAMSETYLRVIK